MLFAGTALAAVIGTVFVLLIVTLTATTDPSELYAILLAGIGLGGLLLLIGLYAVYVLQRILGPVNRIAGATESFAAGNLAARAAVVADDEIGELARSFNAMARESAAVGARRNRGRDRADASGRCAR
jgi:nitrogen fixation/metabolism regulation signal transduction histidine kinase